ncbi:DNA polymerase III subunit delta [Mycoplasma sp. P36-A1]|uniref:DNA polymerase III subunit delta n=1 Tax=Mycoplasma sp. P36-A1 TaxID=3252900 RepID=UPI003C2FFE1C
MIYTIQANDEVLGKEELQKILNKDSVKSDMMNTVEFDCENADIDNIIEYCYTSPFFAQRKIAILKNPIFMSTEKSKKDYTEFVEKLIEYSKKQNESTIMIIYAVYDKVDAKKKIVKYLRDETKYTLVTTPNTMQINETVKHMVNKKGAKISNEAVSMLIEKVGPAFLDLASEVDKLTTFKPKGTIEKQDVIDFATVNVESNIFDLSNAILEKSIPKSITLFEDLIKNGMEPIVLTSVLANQFRLALVSKSYKREGKNNEEIAKILKVHPYRIKLASRLMFSDKDLKNILLKLADLDYHVKTGKINKFHGMKLLILSI